jgi:hypothetical protein
MDVELTDDEHLRALAALEDVVRNNDDASGRVGEGVDLFGDDVRVLVELEVLKPLGAGEVRLPDQPGLHEFLALEALGFQQVGQEVPEGGPFLQRGGGQFLQRERIVGRCRVRQASSITVSTAPAVAASLRGCGTRTSKRAVLSVMRNLSGGGSAVRDPDRLCILPGDPSWLHEVRYLEEGVLRVVAAAAAVAAARFDEGPVRAVRRRPGGSGLRHRPPVR